MTWPLKVQFSGLYFLGTLTFVSKVCSVALVLYHLQRLIIVRVRLPQVLQLNVARRTGERWTEHICI